LPPDPLANTAFFGQISAADECTIEDGEVFQAALQTEWIIDTAAHFHATSNISYLHDIQDLPQPIRLQLADQDSPPILCKQIGKAKIKGHGRTLIILNNVLLADCNMPNIISIHAATSLCPDLQVHLSKTQATLSIPRPSGNKLLLSCPKRHGLYLTQTSPVTASNPSIPVGPPIAYIMMVTKPPSTHTDSETGQYPPTHETSPSRADQDCQVPPSTSAPSAPHTDSEIGQYPPTHVEADQDLQDHPPPICQYHSPSTAGNLEGSADDTDSDDMPELIHPEVHKPQDDPGLGVDDPPETTPALQQQLDNLGLQRARAEMELLSDQIRTNYEEYDGPIDGDGPLKPSDLDTATTWDQWILVNRSPDIGLPLGEVNQNVNHIHFSNNSSLSLTRFGCTLHHLNSRPASPAFNIKPRPPLSKLITAFTSKLPTLLASEREQFPHRSMHKEPSDACSPIIKHNSRLQQMVQAYPTVSTTARPTLQWAICLQAAMVNAHAHTLSFRPKMIMDPRSCAHPGGKVLCVNHLSMNWSPMDFTFINILTPPSLAPKSFDQFFAQICQQLDFDGFPSKPGT
jgi:hypothetical protein